MGFFGFLRRLFRGSSRVTSSVLVGVTVPEVMEPKGMEQPAEEEVERITEDVEFIYTTPDGGEVMKKLVEMELNHDDMVEILRSAGFKLPRDVEIYCGHEYRHVLMPVGDGRIQIRYEQTIKLDLDQADTTEVVAETGEPCQTKVEP